MQTAINTGPEELVLPEGPLVPSNFGLDRCKNFFRKYAKDLVVLPLVPLKLFDLPKCLSGLVHITYIPHLYFYN